MDTDMKAKTADGQTALRRMTSVFVYLFDQVMPDPYVFAVILTFLAAGLAYCFAPRARPQQIAAAWYGRVPISDTSRTKNNLRVPHFSILRSGRE